MGFKITHYDIYNTLSVDEGKCVPDVVESLRNERNYKGEHLDSLIFDLIFGIGYAKVWCSLYEMQNQGYVRSEWNPPEPPEDGSPRSREYFKKPGKKFPSPPEKDSIFDFDWIPKPAYLSSSTSYQAIASRNLSE